MEYNIFAEEIVGYKNKIKNKTSQDYIYYKYDENHISASIADGHGVKRCMFSHRGSEFASKACVEVLDSIFYEIKFLEKCDLINLLNSPEYNNNISKQVHEIWKKYVKEHFKSRIPNVYNVDYILYGTTLIGVLITKYVNLYIQIGDGNILEYESGEFKVIRYDKKNKVPGVLNSMYLEDAPEFIQISYEINTGKKKSVVLFSDGYTNSFENYNELYSFTENTIKNYNRSIFTRYRLTKEYSRYLEYLTINKSKDDISIIYII